MAANPPHGLDGAALTPAQRRVANRVAHYAEKASRARTPIERATVAWDQWRGELAELTPELAALYADHLITLLNDQITQMARLQEDQ